MKKTPHNSAELPRVYKEEEYGLMCQFIQKGLWSNSNLSRVVGVDRETISDWKKRPEAQQAYRQACEEVLKKRRRRGDVEKEMRELDLDVTNDILDINYKVDSWTDDQLKQFIESEATRRVTS